jgi:hypothetical protein
MPQNAAGAFPVVSPARFLYKLARILIFLKKNFTIQKLQLRLITSQRGAVILCLDDYMYKKIVM